MKKIYLLGLLSLGILSSCSEEKFGQDNGLEQKYTITATVEQNAASRSTLDDHKTCNFLWATGDAISVYTGNGFTEFTLNEESNGQANGKFSANVENPTLSGYAIYPASDSHTYDGTTTLSVNMPAVYGSTENVYTANTNAIMLAEVGNGALEFKHMGGVVYVPLSAIPAEADGVMLSANKRITGTFTPVSENEYNVIRTEDAEVTDNNSVTIRFKAGETVSSGFYFPVPLGTYKFTLSWLKGQEATTIIAGSNENEVTRAELLLMPGLATSEGVEQQLRAALADETTTEFILSANIKIEKPLIVKKQFILNLGQYSITNKNATLTAEEGTYNGSVQNLIYVTKTGDLTINDGSIYVAKNSSNIFGAICLTEKGIDGSVTDESQIAKLKVNGTVITGVDYAISGNGNRNNTELYIVNGTFEATGPNAAAIYLPQYGKTTVENGTFKAEGSAIEIRAGELYIGNNNTSSGCIFTSTATTFDTNPNGSGNTIFGAAIAVSQHTTEQDVKVVINSGQFDGIYSLYEKDVQDDPSESISMEINAGSFNGKIYSENCIGFIKNGYFGDAPFEKLSDVKYISDACGEGNSFPIVLGDNEDVSTASVVIPAKANVTLDLNGKTITAANTDAGQIKVYGNFELKDSQTGGLITTNTEAYDKDTAADAIIQVHGKGVTNGAKMTMNGGSIKAVCDETDATDTGHFAVFVVGGATFEMNGGEIEAGWYAVGGNGTQSEEYNGVKSYINIYKGLLKSTADYAIFLPHNGETVIGDATKVSDSDYVAPEIYGKTGAIATRYDFWTDPHLLTINAGKFSWTGNGSSGDWADGTGHYKSAALMLRGDANVTINGGNFNGGAGGVGSAVVSAQETTTVTINDGTFHVLADQEGLGNSCIYAKNSAKVYVKGGTFSSEAPYDGRYWVLNREDASGNSATMEVSGGTFKNFNPAYPTTNDQVENQTPNNYSYVKSGFEVISNDGGDVNSVHQSTETDATYQVVEDTSSSTSPSE